MTHTSIEQQIAKAWNSQADEFNQWDELDFEEKIEWAAKWGASSRTQVVPQFSKVAKQKLDYLLEAGEEITGYAIENKDGRRGAIDCHGFVYWWNEAAPVQMPEPVAYLHECGKKPSLRTLEFSKVAIQLAAKGYKSIPLYTEHQVQELLEKYGIRQG